MKNKKRNRKFRKGRIWILLFLTILTFFSGFWLWENYSSEQRSRELFQELSDKENTGDVLGKSLLKRNPDCIGWISIPGTSFSYPVMESFPENPEYYLHRNFDRKYSFYGTPFLDYRCRLQGDNLIIYGHNINGGRLFGGLQKYREESYGKTYQTIEFTTKTGRETYHLISVLETDISSEWYEFTDVYNNSDYGKLVAYLLEQGKYPTEKSAKIEKELDEGNDLSHKYQFFSLSTCRTMEGKDKRLLVIFVRERGLDIWNPF